MPTVTQDVTVEPGDGFTYHFDATLDAPADKPPPRVIAGWGETRHPNEKRDRRFLAGFRRLPHTCESIGGT